MYQTKSSSKITQKNSHVSTHSSDTSSRNIFSVAQLQNKLGNKGVAQLFKAQRQNKNVIQKKRREQSGLPEQLKTGAENLSGYSLDAVTVHYNSDKPATLNALAYTQGTDIHIGPGQEKHLPHETWHVVQQMQGRVNPTMHQNGVAINDDTHLEMEAEQMGGKASNVIKNYKKVTPNNDNNFENTNNLHHCPALNNASALVQKYTIHGTWKLSENGAYDINTKSPNDRYLYVADGSPGPEPDDKFEEVASPRVGWGKYKFKANFQNDCLGFAEYLSFGKYLTRKSGFRVKDSKSSAKAKDKLFGSTDKSNIKIADELLNKKRKRDPVDPDIGSAYSAIRRDIEPDECPYHVAMVVASDGNDRITCEGDAGSVMNAPVFDMYNVHCKRKKVPKKVGVKGPGKSFEETYEDPYSTIGPPPLIPAFAELIPRKDITV